MKNLFSVIGFLIICASIDIYSVQPSYAASVDIAMSATVKKNNPIENVVDIQRAAQREKIVKFLQFYKSPFVEEIDEIIEAADSCGMKPELIIAISGVESTFGQNYPLWSNNPLGWGIYGNQILSFPSLGKAFEAASCGIAQKYPKDAQENIERLGTIYNGVTPSSWSSKVRFFMKKMEAFAPSKENLTITL